MYDRTGSIEESEDLSEQQFASFFGASFSPLTEEAIDEFAAEYRNSSKEREDVCKYYNNFEGNMTRVFQWVMLSDPDADAHRFMDLLDDAIANQEVPMYAQYKRWSKKVSSRPRPTAGALKGGKSKGRGRRGQDASEQALVAMITGRQHKGALAGTIERLASKYGVGISADEPSEAEFQAARERVDGKAVDGMHHKAKKAKSIGSASRNPGQPRHTKKQKQNQTQ